MTVYRIVYLSHVVAAYRSPGWSEVRAEPRVNGLMISEPRRGGIADWRRFAWSPMPPLRGFVRYNGYPGVRCAHPRLRYAVPSGLEPYPAMPEYLWVMTRATPGALNCAAPSGRRKVTFQDPKCLFRFASIRVHSRFKFGCGQRPRFVPQFRRPLQSVVVQSPGL